MGTSSIGPVHPTVLQAVLVPTTKSRSSAIVGVKERGLYCRSTSQGHPSGAMVVQPLLARRYVFSLRKALNDRSAHNVDLS